MAERDHIVDLPRSGPTYAEDYAAWLDRQIGLMKAGRWREIDKANLIDEVESLGRSDFKGLVSAIEIVIAHMLKWDHQPARRGPSWIASIDEHRARIEQELEDSPSYRSKLAEAVTRAYRPARALASRETGMTLKTFPDACPYDWENIIGREHELAC